MPYIRTDQRGHMTLEQIEQGLRSLKDWPKCLGLSGGEPTLHPQFEAVCELVRKYFPREKAHLFTAHRAKCEEYAEDIDKTFLPRNVHLNEHTEAQECTNLHQPITMAVGDVVPDKAIQTALIENCWCTHWWAGNITERGWFFCEIASGLDRVLEGPGGLPVTDGWWRSEQPVYQEQIDRYCYKCGMCVPMERQLLKDKRARISRNLYELFKAQGLRGLTDDKVDIFEGQFTLDEIGNATLTWTPWNYRQDLPNGPE